MRNSVETFSDPGALSRIFDELQVLGNATPVEDFYLWPRTPIGETHQEIIERRVGVSDMEMQNPGSRPAMIASYLKVLRKHNLIPESFTLLDIACGDSLVLWQLKKKFPESHCYGIDCNIGKFETHEMVQKEGVHLYNAFLQHLFDRAAAVDVALMLNTYRGWESADLRETEKNLPQKADEWLRKNTKYFFVTASDAQIQSLQKEYFVRRLGKGEDRSTMICVSLNRLPGPRRLFSLWRRS